MLAPRHHLPMRLLFICALSSCLIACSSVSVTPTRVEPAQQTAAVPHGDAVPTPPPGAKQAPSAPHDVLDLESLIPNSIAGAPLIKSSHHGTTDDGLDGLVAAVQRSIEDVDVATAATTASRIEQFLTAEVIRVRGADGSRVRDALFSQMAQPGAAPAADVVGGKSVTVLRPAAGTQSPTLYAYATADMVFVIRAVDPALAAELLAALP